MSAIKHTPLPWKMVSEPDFRNGFVYTSVQPVNVDEETMKPLAMMNGEYHVCRMNHTAAEWRFSYHRANAAFIVEACNSYYDMKAEIARLTAENADLRNGEYLAKVVEERDRLLGGRTPLAHVGGDAERIADAIEMATIKERLRAATVARDAARKAIEQGFLNRIPDKVFDAIHEASALATTEGKDNG